MSCFSPLIEMIRSIFRSLFSCCTCSFHSTCCSDDAAIDIDYEKKSQDVTTTCMSPWCTYHRDQHQPDDNSKSEKSM